MGADEWSQDSNPDRRCTPARRPRRNETAGTFPTVSSSCGTEGSRLDRRADGAEDRLDLAAEEDQGDDRDDRDEGEDQRVLRETLSLLVLAERGEELMNERHCGCLLDEYPPPIEG